MTKTVHSSRTIMPNQQRPSNNLQGISLLQPKQQTNTKKASKPIASLKPVLPIHSTSGTVRSATTAKSSPLTPAASANVETAANKQVQKHLPAVTLTVNKTQLQTKLKPHKIAIADEEEEDDQEEFVATSRYGIGCCGRSVSVSWESGWAIRVSMYHIPGIEDDNEVDTNEPKSLLQVRIPFLLLFLLFALFIVWTFVDLSTLPHSFGRPLLTTSAALNSKDVHHFAKQKSLSSHQFYKSRHNITGDDLQGSPPRIDGAASVALWKEFPNSLIPLGPRLPSSVFLSPPYLTLATTPTGAPGVGLHVPCEWLEDRFGKPEQFARLKTEIQFAKLGVNPPAPAPLTPSVEVAASQSQTPASTGLLAKNSTAAPPFIATEYVEVNQLLGSVGLYCQPEVVRDECALEGVSKHTDSSHQRYLSSIEIARLHSWFKSLPEIDSYQEPERASTSTRTPGLVAFNKFTGAIATINCRNQIRYAFPFAKDEIPSVYVEPNFNLLPDAYAQFAADRCTQEARQAAIRATQVTTQKAKEEHAKQLHPLAGHVAATYRNQSKNVTTTIEAAAEPPKRNKWIEPLIPLLPPICSMASFSRPSLARACLRNTRIIGFGDSTTQELLLMLIDFLEQDDGEDPRDLTRMRNDTTKGGQERPAQPASEWMPPDAGSNGEHRYMFIEHWTPEDGCYDNAKTTFMGRLFSTARFPTPYLSAYNITVTMRWNVGVESCSASRAPNRASDVDMYRAGYRWLKMSCLPDNAVEIAEKYRRKLDGTMRTPAEFVEHVNGIFHNLARDNQRVYKEDPPPTGCKYPYLPLEESNALTLPEWQLHLPSVPNFDFAVMGMGAHMAEYWNNPDAQRTQDGYSYNPEQFHHAFESHLVLVQSFARNVVIRETAWRNDERGGTNIPLMNEVIREVAIEAQARALRHDMEVEQLLDIVRRTAVGDQLVTFTPPRRSVNWLPTFFNTAMLQKEDNDHCSYKSVGGGFGVNGMRTPYCYPIVQKMIEVFCTNK